MGPRPKLTTEPWASLALDTQQHQASSATAIIIGVVASDDRPRAWTRYQLLCLLRAWRLVTTAKTLQSSPELLAKRIYDQSTALCKRGSISDSEDWSESEVLQMRNALVESYKFITRFNASGGVGGAAGQRVVNWFAISEREQLSIVDERFGKACEFVFCIDEATYDMIGLILDEGGKPVEAKNTPMELSTSAAASEPAVPSPNAQDSTTGSPAPTVVTSVVALDSQPTAAPPQVSTKPAAAAAPSQGSSQVSSSVLSRLEQQKQEKLEKEIADREAILPSHIWRRGELFRLMRLWGEMLDELEVLPSEPTQEFKDELYERFCGEPEKEAEMNGEEPIPRTFQATWSKVGSLVRSYEFIQDFNNDEFHWMTPSVRIPKPESWFELSDSYQQWVAKKYFKPRNKLPVTFTYVYSDMMDAIEENRSKSLVWWATSKKQRTANANPVTKPSPTVATQPRPKVPSPRSVRTAAKTDEKVKVMRPGRTTVPPPAKPAANDTEPNRKLPSARKAKSTAKKDTAVATVQPNRNLAPPPAPKVKRGRKPNWREDELSTLLRAWSAAVNEHPVPDEKLGDESFDTHVFVKFVALSGSNSNSRDLAQVRAKLTSFVASCAFISDFNKSRSRATTASPKSWFSLSETKQKQIVNDQFKDKHSTVFTFVTKEIMALVAKNSGIELSATPPSVTLAAPVSRTNPKANNNSKRWSREELVQLLQAWLNVTTRRQPHDDEGTLLSQIYAQFQVLCGGKSTKLASMITSKKSDLLSSFNDLKDFFVENRMSSMKKADWFSKSESGRWELMDVQKKAQQHYVNIDAGMFRVMEKIVDAERQVAFRSSSGRSSRTVAASSAKQARVTRSTAKAARAQATSSESNSSESDTEVQTRVPQPSSGCRATDLQPFHRFSPAAVVLRVKAHIAHESAIEGRPHVCAKRSCPADQSVNARKRQRVDSQGSTAAPPPPSVDNQQQQQQIELLQSMLDEMREERDLEREERRSEREERRQEREETKRELEAWRQERLREQESFQALLREFEGRK